MASDFIKEKADSAYAHLNSIIFNVRLPKAELKWIFLTEKQRENSLIAYWKNIILPATCRSILKYDSSIKDNFICGETSVSIVPCLGQPNDDKPYDGLEWMPINSEPDRILSFSESYQDRLVPIWTQTPQFIHSRPLDGMYSTFDPKWEDLCGASFESVTALRGSIWNKNNTLVKSADHESVNILRKHIKSSSDPLLYGEAILASKSHAAAWILLCIESNFEDLWNGIIDRDPDFIPAIWKILFEGPEEDFTRKQLYFFKDAATRSHMRVVGQSGWSETAHRGLTKHLGKPSADWTLIFKK